jgi:hypothetical protein
MSICPISVADAPRSIKTKEKPAINMREFLIIIPLTRALSPPFVNSSIERPVINDTYEGRSGRTHGDTKDRNPAENAIKEDIPLPASMLTP